VEPTPALEVYDLVHLGLVAGIMDRIGLVEVVDQKVGPRPQEKVSTGMALKAAVLNALGFVATSSTTSSRASPKTSSWALARKVERGEEEAGKVLGRLLARRFACEEDARRALEEASASLAYHRLVFLGVRVPDQKGKPTRKPTLRWMFQYFM